MTALFSSNWPLQLQVNAVIVGYDKHFSMAKLVKACSYAKNPQNHFIGTNMDTYLPIENKEILIPGRYYCPLQHLGLMEMYLDWGEKLDNWHDNLIAPLVEGAIPMLWLRLFHSGVL